MQYFWRKSPSYSTSLRNKIRLNLDVSSNRKGTSVFLLYKQDKKTSHKVVTKTQRTRLLLILLLYQPHLHFYRGLDMKKERLKEETFNLKVKFQEMEPENEKLKNNNF